MERLRSKNKPSGEASSSSESRASRWKNRLKQKLGGSSKAPPANRDHELDTAPIITGPHSSSQVVDEAKLPSASNTATTLAEPAPSESCTTSNKTTPKDGGATATDSRSLWDLAYEALRKEKPKVMQAYEELLFKMSPYLANASSTANLDDILSEASDDLPNIPFSPNTRTAECETQRVPSSRMMMEGIIVLGRKQMEGKQIAFKIGQQEFVLQDQMKHLVDGIKLGKDWIDDAVQASPEAKTAWACVCLLLPLLTNPSEVEAANKEGLAYVTQKIRYYTAMESLHLRGEDEEVLPANVMQEYRNHLIELYQAIIDFQAQSVSRFYRRRFINFLKNAVKWDPWETMSKRNPSKSMSPRAEKHWAS
ncbi:hypothetical protein RB596_008760 [Gaeumannomyces avenae]